MKKFFCFLIGILVFTSCQTKTAENQNTEPKEALEMYEPSEMAMLMEQMYAHNLQLQQLIKNKEDLGNFPTDFNKIFIAGFTDASDNDIFFQDNAKIYIELQKDIYQSENPAKAFNKMVDACIRCHQVKCGGPITRIKKLYISPNVQP